MELDGIAVVPPIEYTAASASLRIVKLVFLWCPNRRVVLLSYVEGQCWTSRTAGRQLRPPVPLNTNKTTTGVTRTTPIDFCCSRSGLEPEVEWKPTTTTQGGVNDATNRVMITRKAGVHSAHGEQ
jgi:hypothetical protein